MRKKLETAVPKPDADKNPKPTGGQNKPKQKIWGWIIKIFKGRKHEK